MSDAISILSTPNFNQFELVKTGTLAVSKASGSTQASASVSHGLGFSPAYLAYLEVSSYQHQLPLVLFDTPTSNREVYDAYVDDTTFNGRITVQTSGTTINVVIRYYLFRVRAG